MSNGTVLFDATATATSSKGIPGVTVDKDGADRANADEQAAIEAGFAPRPPIYTVGTLVNETGIENFRAARMEFEAKPTVNEATEALTARITAEGRENVLTNANVLDMNPGNGEILVVTDGEGKSFPLTERALTGLCQFVTPGGGSYLANCPINLRADNLNYWLGRATRVDARATTKAHEAWLARVQDVGMENAGPAPGEVEKPVAVTLRTRNNPNATSGREIFAVTGPRYGVFDVDQIAQEVAKGVPDGARCDITYDGYRMRMNVLFHTTVEPEHAVAGEFFRAGIIITSADDGSGAIRVRVLLERNLCLNLIIIDTNYLQIGSRKHIGNSGDIAKDVGLYIQAAMEKIGRFVDRWNEASVDNVLEAHGLDDVESVFRGLVKNRVVHVPGVKADELVARYMNAWRKEPGHSRAAIINAITRAAHESEWSSWETAEELETVAGNLLFTPLAKWKVQVEDKTATL